jgi:hypothetical protein
LLASEQNVIIVRLEHKVELAIAVFVNFEPACHIFSPYGVSD